MYILGTLMCQVCVILIGKYICEKSINSKRFIPIMVSEYSILIAVSIIFDYQIFVIIHTFSKLIIATSTKFCFKKFKLTNTYYIYGLLFCSNYILSLSLHSCFQIPVELGPFVYSDFVIYIISFSICLLCCLNKTICKKIKQVVNLLPKRIKIILLISLILCSWIMLLIVANPILSENSPWSITLRISIVLLALFLCITFPIVILIAMTNAYLKKQNENFEERLEAQADYYTQLSRSNFEMRRFRHDFKNMQIGLRTYIEANDLPSAIAVLDGEQENLQSATDIITYDTGNGIVDAILMDKQQKAADKNIKIEFTGAIPMTALSAVDLCVIFGNTLDNALEACEKLPPDETKTISISSICNSGFMFITITNPVLENVTIKGNTVETTKNDRNLHGYGLYSLTRAVKKYDGDVKLKSENNTFTVEIELTLI